MKKIAAVLLALAMAVSACACSKDTSSTRTKRDTKTSAAVDDDDDDDDDEDETKKTRKTKKTEAEDPDETEEDPTEKTKKETTEETEEETTTTEEETTTTEEETTTEKETTTTEDDSGKDPTGTTTTFDLGNIGNFDVDSLKNDDAKKWVKDLKSEGCMVLDFTTYVDKSSFPQGTVGMASITSDMSKVYFYIEIALDKTYTEDDMKLLAEQIASNGTAEVTTKGDTLILTNKADKIWGALDMKTGYFLIVQNVTGDYAEDTELATKLGFKV